ncbi:hypothetical protein C4N16_01770 [Fusobacterium gonidiaformans ATCC 25563]|nr:hypothetical protein C4N16_01770 [Fusobacterium gonidiaformans ATCC 25563]EFS28902.1 hypothetical protein FGAG_01223 [Fusobacterium gonidiaformans ATCC 25563]
MKKEIIYTSSIRLSKDNYEYIQKKALEVGISQNALMNVLLNLGSQVMNVKNFSDFVQNSQYLSK